MKYYNNAINPPPSHSFLTTSLPWAKPSSSGNTSHNSHIKYKNALIILASCLPQENMKPQEHYDKVIMIQRQALLSGRALAVYVDGRDWTLNLLTLGWEFSGPGANDSTPCISSWPLGLSTESSQNWQIHPSPLEHNGTGLTAKYILAPTLIPVQHHVIIADCNWLIYD